MSAALCKVLFWLMILALPLHGIAAAGMLPQHRAGHAAMQMQDGGRHGSGAAVEAAGAMQQLMTGCADPTADCGHAQLKGIVKCNLSAPCGLVAADGPHRALPLDRLPPAAPISVPSHERIAFCTGAPERPPRLSV